MIGQHQKQMPRTKQGIIWFWWPEAESNHRHKDFQLSDRPYFRFLPYKVNPTIDKLCAQNFLGCLYETDLVELFWPTQG
jgi:hypothetical protein